MKRFSGIRIGFTIAVLVVALIAKLSADESTWKSLFNGKDLSGWVGNASGFRVEKGVLVCLDQGGALFTADEYADFVLRLEFRLTAGANNGIGIRAPLSGIATYDGIEIQILDDSSSAYKDLEPYQYNGSIYGVVPAKRGHLRPVGQWNAEEIQADRDNLVVRLNGTIVVDTNLSEISRGAALDSLRHRGLKNKKGHIGLLGHTSKVYFRNLFLKELH